MKKKISAIDVAKAAGVSQSTVSRVFSAGANVSLPTKERVLREASRLNYQPNAIAQSLITRKTNIVGIAVKDIQNPFYHETLAVFTKKLKERGLNVLFVYTENDEVQQEEINDFLKYNVEGIIVADAFLSSNLVSDLRMNEIPVVLFNRYLADTTVNSVSCDNYNAAKNIAKYIFNKGYKKIVFLSGKENTSTSQDREKGFIHFFEEKGIKVEKLKGDYTYETSYKLINELVQQKYIPEAIFGANDITAIGVLDALKKNKINVPNQSVVIGFDNIKMSSWPTYSLTTWSQPLEIMVEKTIDLLLEKNNHKNPKNIKIKGEFIKRESTEN